MRIRRGDPWLTLASATLGAVMVGLNGSVVAIGLPTISRDLHASFSDLQWISNAYLLALAASLIIGGKLGDRFGRRVVFMIGVVGFAGVSVGCGLVGSIGGLIAFRGAQGLLGALLVPNTIALLRAAFPPEKLNTAIGIWGGASAVSVAAGPIVGGLLVQHASWEWVFYINVPVGLVALGIGLLVLSESREPGGSSFDPPGIAALAVGLFCVIYGIIKAETWGWGSARNLALIIGGLAVLGLFVLIEARVSRPLVPLGLFKSRVLSVSAIVLILTFLALFGTLFYLTLYLQNVHGYSPVQAGIRQLPMSAMFVLSAPLGGFLNERFGPRVAIPPAMLLVGLGVLSFTRLTAHSDFVHLWPGLIATGFGVGIVAVAAADGIVAGAPVEEGGIAGGITTTSQQLGGVLGTGLLGSLLASRVASSLFGHLVGAGVPVRAADAIAASANVKQLVGQGIAPPIPGASGVGLRAIVLGSHQAFISGLHTAMLVAACGAFLAAGLGLLLRSKPSTAPAAAGVAPAAATA